MSGTKTTKTKPTPIKTVRPHVAREDHPVRWPSVATGSGAAFVAHEPSKGETCPETGSEG